MSIENELADIFKNKKDNNPDGFFIKPYMGWQCPICFEVYNPLIMNCIKNHISKKRRFDGRYNNPL